MQANTRPASSVSVAIYEVVVVIFDEFEDWLGKPELALKPALEFEDLMGKPELALKLALEFEELMRKPGLALKRKLEPEPEPGLAAGLQEHRVSLPFLYVLEEVRLIQEKMKFL